MISDISLDFLSWSAKGVDKPLPELTWAALSKVPPVVFGMGGLMAGVYWTIGRRMRMQALAADSATPVLDAENPVIDKTAICEEERTE